MKFTFRTVWGCLFLGTLLLSSLAGAEGMRGRDKDIGVILKVTATPDSDTAAFKQALLKTLQTTYGRKLVEMTVTSDDANALMFAAAKNRIDHVLEIQGAGSAQKPVKGATYQFTGQARIIDLAVMKGEAPQPIEVKGRVENDDVQDSAYVFLAKQIIQKMTAFYNPNLMGKLNIRKSADFFYDQNRCAEAAPLYDVAAKEESQFDLLDEINKRIAKCRKQVSTQQRMQAKYALELKFNKLSPAYQAYFQQALQEGKFAAIFQQYSDKPVTLTVSYFGGGTTTAGSQSSEGGSDGGQAGGAQESSGAPGEVLMTLFHDARRFNIQALGQASSTQKTLDLSPYNGVLKELIRFKWLALAKMPAAQREVFSKFTTRVRFEKPNGDWLTFLVNIDREKRLEAPTKILLEVTGYKATEVEQASASLAGGNRFVLGPAYNIDGKETVYRIVYQFFDIKP